MLCVWAHSCWEPWAETLPAVLVKWAALSSAFSLPLAMWLCSKISLSRYTVLAAID